MADATVTPAAVGAPWSVPGGAVGGSAVIVSAVVAPAPVQVVVTVPAPVVFQPFDTWRPRFSPDHVVMLVCRTAPGHHDTNLTSMTLWAFAPEGFDGDQTRKVKNIPSTYGWTSYGHPEWTPDSTQVVIYVETSTQYQIVLLDSFAWTTDATLYSVNKPDTATDPSCLANGDVIFVEKVGSTYYISKVTNAATPVHTHILSSSNPLADPMVSPDGTKIAYAERTYAPDMTYTYGKWALKTVPIGGGSPTTVLSNNNAHQHPTWLTGRSLLFQTFRYGTDSAQHVARIKTNGNSYTVLGEGEYPEAQKI